MNKPLSVLIADVHYSLPTLKLADAAMRQAIAKANELNVPVIVAGDLHDTKANLRGECVNAMIETFEACEDIYIILRGNHDAINERSKEHSLNFLTWGEQGIVLTNPVKHRGLYFIPYYHDVDELRTYLKTIPKGSTLIMHQGLTSAKMGDYIQDKSALRPEDVAGFRVISGHYHERQTIQLPDGGVWDYVGNPYTLSFGEANDPSKGFQILYDDGSLEFVPTNLRKHVVHDCTFPMLGLCQPDTGDLLWIKIRGTHEQLAQFNRTEVSKAFGLKEGFKLDLIPLGGITEKPTKQLASAELMDSLIDSLTNTSDERKTKLKELWRHLGS